MGRRFKAFPFLIGRIRTPRVTMKLYDSNGFPFLIGRIRTDQSNVKYEANTRLFPFLIGRIRTEKSNKEKQQRKGFHSS